MRLILFITIFLITLSSCASMQNQNIASSYTKAFYSMKGAIFGFEDANITKDLVENIPYASALLKIGKGSKGLVILESINGSQTTWASVDNVLVVMDDGRITRTLGLINNLTSYLTPDQSFRDLVLKTEPLLKYYSYYSYDKPQLNSLRVEVNIANKGIRKIEILGESRSLILFEEEIYSEVVNWRRINKYWVDPRSYYVWKSIQFISPKLPPFTIEVTKKPAI